MNITIIRNNNPFVIPNATNNRFLSLVDGLISLGCNINLFILDGYYDINEKEKYGSNGLFNGINYKYLVHYNFGNFFVRQFFLRIYPKYILKKEIIKHYKNFSSDYLWVEMGFKSIKVGLSIVKSNTEIKIIHERSEYSWYGFSNNKKLHNEYLSKFLPKTSVLFIMTHKLIEYYSKYAGPQTKIIHLPMTVDFSRFDIRNENNLKKPYIGYCGSLDNQKDGVNILILAFIKIMNKFPNHHLYIVGNQTPVNDYEIQQKIIIQNNASNRITYLGVMTREEIPIFLLNASILAFARPSSKQAEGGFPTKLGEYLAAGKPICITNTGEISLYLKDQESAFIAEPNSIDSFSHSLQDAILSEKAYEIGKNGRVIALNVFNKDIQSLKMFNVLINNKIEPK